MDEEQEMLDRIRRKFQQESDARLFLARQQTEGVTRNLEILREASRHLQGFPIRIANRIGTATFYSKTYPDDPTIAHCGLTILGDNRVATPTTVRENGYYDNYNNHLTVEQVVKWWENTIFDSIEGIDQQTH